MKFELWWDVAGIQEMPKNDEPPAHASVAQAAWKAAFREIAPGGYLYREMLDNLEFIAEKLNGGEYKTFVTHVIMPTVLGTMGRAAKNEQI